jgi:hypothetical protein
MLALAVRMLAGCSLFDPRRGLTLHDLTCVGFVVDYIVMDFAGKDAQ